MRALRRDREEDARRRARHLRLRELPAAPAEAAALAAGALAPLAAPLAHRHDDEPDDEPERGHEDEQRLDPMAGVCEYEHRPQSRTPLSGEQRRQRAVA